MYRLGNRLLHTTLFQSKTVLLPILAFPLVPFDDILSSTTPCLARTGRAFVVLTLSPTSQPALGFAFSVPGGADLSLLPIRC